MNKVEITLDLDRKYHQNQMIIILIYKVYSMNNDNWYSYEFSSIEKAVRIADTQFKTQIINVYIVMGLDRAKAMHNANNTRRAHLRIYNTLLNTMCDDCLPILWRETCYHYLVQMMPLIKVIVDNKEFKQRKNEINLLHHYFLGYVTAHKSSVDALGLKNS